MARTRSARAHADVLDAAAHLFAERGLDGTSMDAIAETSGVSKATIYKHWPDKDALCLEVMARVHGRDSEEPPDFDSGDLRADLVAVLSQQPPSQYAGLRQRIMPHLIAYSARNLQFGHAWRTRVLNPPRQQLARILERAVKRGLLPAWLNVDLGVALLFGPLFYRYVLKLADMEKPDAMREQIVDAFLRSYALPSAKAPAKAPAAAHGAAHAAAAPRKRRVASTRRPSAGTARTR
jgi:AcrR family transcriptional regulator